MSAVNIGGLEVRLWRHCHCGCAIAHIHNDTSLFCRCENYRGTLTADVCRFLASFVAEFGRPDSPIILNPANSRASADKPEQQLNLN